MTAPAPKECAACPKKVVTACEFCGVAVCPDHGRDRHACIAQTGECPKCFEMMDNDGQELQECRVCSEVVHYDCKDGHEESCDRWERGVAAEPRAAKNYTLPLVAASNGGRA